LATGFSAAMAVKLVLNELMEMGAVAALAVPAPRPDPAIIPVRVPPASRTLVTARVLVIFLAFNM
jgi:hypothetical protein